MRPAALLQLWFGLSLHVDRRAYFLSGAGLMLLKYSVDCAGMAIVTGRFWAPLAYLSPALFAREASLGDPPSWILWLLGLWTIPFLWIGASMSIRRAVDAGLSPWVGCLFFAPFVNYLMMLTLCLLPSAQQEGWRDADPSLEEERGWLPFFYSGLVASLLGLAMLGVSVFLVKSYGLGLFVGTPFCMGMVAGYLYNRPSPHTEWSTTLVVQFSLLLAGLELLLFALEGVVCLVMAYPLASVTAAMGGAVGRRIALQGAMHAASLATVLLALPLLTGADARSGNAPLREVVSAIEIDAPPEEVWPNVVGFSALPAPAEWIFDLGIAYPQRARIEGRGVGAVRRCEFSTGAFVEPITRWEPPTRLTFDVARQPPPMHEWSPYRHVHAPHLLGSLQTRRGEFRLIPLEGGGTLLEGSTWYQLELFPQAYWALWADSLIHAIHHRVLRHVRTLSEPGTGLSRLPAGSAGPRPTS